MGRLVTLDEVKPYLGTDRSGGQFDAFLTTLIGGAELFIEKEARRRFSPNPTLAAGGADTNPPVAKSFASYGRGSLRVPDLRIVTSMTLGGTTLDADDYALVNREDEPAYEIEFSQFVTPSVLRTNRSEKDLVITGRWGFNPVPDDVKDAVCLMVARAFKEREANYAEVVQAGPEAAAFSYMRTIPKRAQATIEHYQILRFARV